MRFFWLMLALILTLLLSLLLDGCAGWTYTVGVTYPPLGAYLSITPPKAAVVSAAVGEVSTTQPAKLVIK